MTYYTDTNDPTFYALTEAGLRAFDRWHRHNEARTISLAKSPDGVWTHGGNEGGAAVVAQ